MCYNCDADLLLAGTSTGRSFQRNVLFYFPRHNAVSDISMVFLVICWAAIGDAASAWIMLVRLRHG